jgi:nucleotide-binding universal stress UspA family protein
MKLKNSKPSGKAQIKAPRGQPIVRSILATTDFSNESLAAVRYALSLGRTIGSTVTLVHVIDPGSRFSGMESVVLARQESEVSQLAQEQLAALARREAGEDPKVKSLLRTGRPFHEIASVAGERGADLIVIGTHGHTGVKRVLLGSTAERVVRHAPCPVLTVPTRYLPKRAGRTASFDLRQILVPIDFSVVSKVALPYAVLLAKHYGAKLVLAHIVEKFPIDFLMGRELMSETLVPVMKQTESDLEEIAADLRQSTDLKVAAVVREGRPYDEICRAAKKANADLIAITTHGYTGMKHVWLGSTAERVVRHAGCPVLVVR